MALTVGVGAIGSVDVALLCGFASSTIIYGIASIINIDTSTEIIIFFILISPPLKFMKREVK